MAEVDPELLSALAGLLEHRSDDAPAEPEEPEQPIQEVSESLYERLAELEKRVN